MHIVIGNTEMEIKELVENLQTLMTTLKDKISKISLAATMSPGLNGCRKLGPSLISVSSFSTTHSLSSTLVSYHLDIERD